MKSFVFGIALFLTYEGITQVADSSGIHHRVFSFNVDGVFTKERREGTVYKWEPILNCQTDVLKQTHSFSLFLAKTYYDYGRGGGFKLYGIRGRKTKGFGANLGLGGTLLYKDKFYTVPFGHLHLIYKLSHSINLVQDHRFHVDFTAGKFNWSPMLGIEYLWWGLNFGYTISQDSPILNQLDGWTLGGYITIGYHKLRIIRRVVKARRAIKEAQEGKDGAGTPTLD